MHGLRFKMSMCALHITISCTIACVDQVQVICVLQMHHNPCAWYAHTFGSEVSNRNMVVSAHTVKCCGPMETATTSLAWPRSLRRTASCNANRHVAADGLSAIIAAPGAPMHLLWAAGRPHVRWCKSLKQGLGLPQELFHKRDSCSSWAAVLPPRSAEWQEGTALSTAQETVHISTDCGS